MSVNDVCDCLKNDIVGLKTAMISVYVHDFNEYNISGRVLATCVLDELKPVCKMACLKIYLHVHVVFFSQGSFYDIW